MKDLDQRKALRLFHGTTRDRARKIQQMGFKLPEKPSYTGRTICLTDDMCLAHQYGAMEDSSVVLECRLKPEAVVIEPPSAHKAIPNFDLGQHCIDMQADAVWAWSMWVVSNPDCIETIRVVPHAEVVKIMTDEFIANGPEVGYNGRTADYAELWWDENPITNDIQRAIAARLARHSDYLVHLKTLRANACQPA